MAAELPEIARRLAEAGRRFDARGWVLGTSGNFSAVITRDPLRLAITASGAWKGDLTASEILEMDADLSAAQAGSLSNATSRKPAACNAAANSPVPQPISRIFREPAGSAARTKS